MNILVSKRYGNEWSEELRNDLPDAYPLQIGETCDIMD